VRETDKLTGQFVEPGVVRAAWDRLETWSQLVAEALEVSPLAP
jgi:predicted NUDIX family phosphoesterase